MPSRHDDFSPEDDLDEEGDEFEDVDYDEDDTDVAVCPRCGAEVYDDADRCPECRTNLVTGRKPSDALRPSGLAWPTWVVITAAVTSTPSPRKARWFSTRNRSPSPASLLR